ncbi:MAG: hypothetical protein ABR521_02570 [Gaiellaceae bacterium]
MGASGDVTEGSPGAFGGGSPERTGVVVIRVWLESADAGRGLRARISLVRDVECGETESVVAGSAGEILEAVRRFVDEFVG